MSSISLDKRINYFLEDIKQLQNQDTSPRNPNDLAFLHKTFAHMESLARNLKREVQSRQDLPADLQETMDQHLSVLGQKVQQIVANSYSTFAEGPITPEKKLQMDLLVATCTHVQDLFSRSRGPIPMQEVRSIEHLCVQVQYIIGEEGLGPKVNAYLEGIISKANMFANTR
jgi:hypothetical protein